MSILRRIALILGAIALVAFCIAAADWCGHTILVHLSQETGTSNSSSRAYDFWSGFGSDIGEATIILGLVTAGRHLNCVTRGCWRIALHKSKDPKTGVEYRQCHRHHPDLKNHAHPHFWQHHFTDEHLADVHQRIKESRTADQA